jgi:hypothetical protein
MSLSTPKCQPAAVVRGGEDEQIFGASCTGSKRKQDKGRGQPSQPMISDMMPKPSNLSQLVRAHKT